MKDLCLLVADLDIAQAMEAALKRPKSLDIRNITFEIKTHPNRDSGMRTTRPQMLSLLNRQYSHGLLILDYEGSGTQKENSIALEKELDARLRTCWGRHAKAIAIEPELEAWMWGNDNTLREILEWRDDRNLHDWLTEQGFQFLPNNKPVRPKESFEKILSEMKCRRSSTIYADIASRISLQKCSDASFLRLRNTLIDWFGQKKVP